MRFFYCFSGDPIELIAKQLPRNNHCFLCFSYCFQKKLVDLQKINFIYEETRDQNICYIFDEKD